MARDDFNREERVREKTHTKDKRMAQADVKYKQVWKCKVCDEKVRFPKDAWDGWSKDQRDAYIAELERAHLVHPED